MNSDERPVRFDANGDLWRRALESSMSAFDARGKLIEETREERRVEGCTSDLEGEVQLLRRRLTQALRINQVLEAALRRAVAVHSASDLPPRGAASSLGDAADSV